MVDFLAGQLGLDPFDDRVDVLNVVNVDNAVAIHVERRLATGFSLLSAPIVGDAILFDTAFVELEKREEF